MNTTLSTKDAVVMMLREQADYLSGEEISTRLQISRAAVNAAVKGLRADGYTIDSATNRGYLLTGAPDILSAGEIAAYLAAHLAGGAAEAIERMRTVTVLDTVDSTNRALMQMAEEGAADGQIVIADRQTAGRGRLGRPFSSPGGMGIYFSYLVRPLHHAGSASSFTALTSRAAVAVSLAIEETAGVCPDIKWVNDLYLGAPESRRKICGILTQMELEPESASVRHIIVGIGVNVREKETDFPEELRHIAGSVFSATGKKLCRAHLAGEMILRMDRMNRGETSPAEELAHYRAHSLLAGQRIDVIEGENRRAGCAVSLEDDYGLRVRFDDGTEEVLHGGEVSIRTQE